MATQQRYKIGGVICTAITLVLIFSVIIAAAIKEQYPKSFSYTDAGEYWTVKNTYEDEKALLSAIMIGGSILAISSSIMAHSCFAFSGRIPTSHAVSSYQTSTTSPVYYKPHKIHQPSFASTLCSGIFFGLSCAIGCAAALLTWAFIRGILDDNFMHAPEFNIGGFVFLAMLALASGTLFTFFKHTIQSIRAQDSAPIREQIEITQIISCEGPAKIQNGATGWLFLTNNALEFHPIPPQLLLTPCCILLTQILDINITSNKTLVIQTAYQQYRFTVTDAASWESQLLSAIQAANNITL